MQYIKKEVFILEYRMVGEEYYVSQELRICVVFGLP